MLQGSPIPCNTPPPLTPMTPLPAQPLSPPLLSWPCSVFKLLHRWWGAGGEGGGVDVLVIPVVLIIYNMTPYISNGRTVSQLQTSYGYFQDSVDMTHVLDQAVSGKTAIQTGGCYL